MDDAFKKWTYVSFAMWVAVSAMIAVLFIDLQIKKEILTAANGARDTLEKWQVLYETAEPKGTGLSGRATVATPDHPDKWSGDGSGPVDRSSADVAKGSANGTGRAGAKSSARKSTGTNRRSGSAS